MKRIIIAALAVLILIAGACSRKAADAPLHPDWTYNTVVYEVNIRQFSPEGTFKGVEAQLPRLKDLGVDILWLMPMYKIGEVERKGTLGSYYAISDYTAVNPEFGTLEDFDSLIAAAHEAGFKVILDWVANHTAPDSEWTKNEGWHYRDEAGNLMVQYDWTDISKLNYDNQDMRNEMLKCMHWWMDSIGIDGFRCDVAGEVPTDFWNWAMSDLRKTHPCMFTLAEDEDKANELTESAFDMFYGWSLHHTMNNVAQGKATVEDLWANLAKTDSTVRPEAIRMNFITNHDENSWNGTEFERMGDAVKLMATLCYILPGMPMIYTGQLSGNHHRLEFFEKDLIDKEEAFAQADLYRSLNALRARNKALFSPEAGAPLERIGCDNAAIFACKRSLKGKYVTNEVIAVMNMSDKEQEVTLETGEKFNLAPWGYEIIEK